MHSTVRCSHDESKAWGFARSSLPTSPLAQSLERVIGSIRRECLDQFLVLITVLPSMTMTLLWAIA